MYLVRWRHTNLYGVALERVNPEVYNDDTESWWVRFPCRTRGANSYLTILYYGPDTYLRQFEFLGLLTEG